MTAATGPAPPPGNAPGPTGVPRLAEGTELLGEFKDSGYSQPPSLVRRADGQVIQMPRLLYSVACRIDGSRGPSVIAELVSEDLGRSLNADQVRYLITAKLSPLGIVAGQGAAAAPPKAAPLLALSARGTLLPGRAANAIGAFLQPLCRWPVVVAVIVSVAAVDYWLFAAHGLTSGLGQVLRDPVDLLIVFGLSMVSAVFHECGHAAGCRYGGPAGSASASTWSGRRSSPTSPTPTGSAAAAGRAPTSAEILLLVIAVTHLEMLQQLLPFVRFDGYFILSDLVGVPDLFARVAPIVRSAPSRGRRDPRVADLRRGARIAVTGWVLCVIPLLTLTIGYLLLHLPQINRALWRSTSLQAHLVATAAAGRHYTAAAVDAIGAALAALSVIGSLCIVTGLARRAAIMSLRWSAGRPARRVLAAVAAVACATSLAACWAIQGQFRGW